MYHEALREDQRIRLFVMQFYGCRADIVKLDEAPAIKWNGQHGAIT
jgi:hypothetical protein